MGRHAETPGRHFARIGQNCPYPLGRGAQVDVKSQARHRDTALPLCSPAGVWPGREVARPVAELAGLPCAPAPGRGALAQQAATLPPPPAAAASLVNATACWAEPYAAATLPPSTVA